MVPTIMVEAAPSEESYPIHSQEAMSKRTRALSLLSPFYSVSRGEEQGTEENWLLKPWRLRSQVQAGKARKLVTSFNPGPKIRGPGALMSLSKR